MKPAIGPGALVAAAFIGPGTVTACTLAGAKFGFALIWALVFATVATIILQSMAARLGVVGRRGLGEALVSDSTSPALKWVAGGLVIAALALGNAAYEAGNLSGGALGVEAILGEGPSSRRIAIAALTVLAALVLAIGRYKTIERILVVLVIIMSISFASSAVLTRPDIGSMLAGLKPEIPENGLLTAVALIGTTIVPYNLFLHAAAARERWTQSDPESLAAAKRDTMVSIGLGGLVSILIMSTAAAALFGSSVSITGAQDMALAIEPTFGPAARYLVGIGLLGAGLTSAITAPLATAYALSEIFGTARNGIVFKAVAFGVLLIGAAIALLGAKPVTVIFIAQVANGLLLPIIAVFLLAAMNRKALLGAQTNTMIENVCGGIIVLVTLGLGARLVLRAIGVWP